LIKPIRREPLLRVVAQFSSPAANTRSFGTPENAELIEADA